FLNYYRTKYGIQYDVYRVSNVYGEGQNVGKGLGIINTFLEKIIKKDTIEIFGNGESTRNYIYVKDVAELLCHSLRTLNSSDVYNVSSNNTLSINELLEIIRKTVSEELVVKYTDNRQSDNTFIDLINTKIMTSHGNFKFTDIQEGVQKTYT